MTVNLQVYLLPITIGLLAVGLGLAARFGYLKSTFITRGILGIYPKNTGYALMPAGLMFLSTPLYLWVGETIFNIIFFGLMLLALVSLIWQPRWFKPAWLRWLEDHYGHVLDEMFEEARQMGIRNWEAQVRTQADLEDWANSVAQRRGWQRLS